MTIPPDKGTLLQKVGVAVATPDMADLLFVGDDFGYVDGLQMDARVRMGRAL